MPEVAPGYPDRLLPKDEAAARELRKRTLTNLYNQRPAWLASLHRELDTAVAAAYGWPADLPDEEILKRLLELNRERAAAAGSPRRRGEPRADELPGGKFIRGDGDLVLAAPGVEVAGGDG
jgi:hypothetical protein